MPSLLVVGAALAQATSTDRARHRGDPRPAPPPDPPGRGCGNRPAPQPRPADPGSRAGLVGGGIPRARRRPRRRGAAMEEILEILPLAWTGEPFTHHGAVYDLPRWPSGRRPRPGSRFSSVAARSRRSGAPPGSPTGSSSARRRDQFVEQVHWVLDECERIGRDPATLPVHPLLGPAGRSIAGRSPRPLPRGGLGDAVEVLGHGGLGDAAACRP